MSVDVFSPGSTNTCKYIARKHRGTPTFTNVNHLNTGESRANACKYIQIYAATCKHIETQTNAYTRPSHRPMCPPKTFETLYVRHSYSFRCGATKS